MHTLFFSFFFAAVAAMSSTQTTFDAALTTRASTGSSLLIVEISIRSVDAVILLISRPRQVIYSSPLPFFPLFIADHRLFRTVPSPRVPHRAGSGPADQNRGGRASGRAPGQHGVGEFAQSTFIAATASIAVVIFRRHLRRSLSVSIVAIVAFRRYHRGHCFRLSFPSVSQL